MIEAFTPHRADEPFNVTILQGRPRRDRTAADTHRGESLVADISLDAVAVADQGKAW